MRFENAQQALPVVDNGLPSAPKVFKRLFVGRFHAKPPESVARCRAGAHDFAHKSVKHLSCRPAKLLLKGLDTRILPGHSFTHTVTSLSNASAFLVSLM
ncbi:MAG: hypothetical protein CFK52_00160 [Chloracidobacterium sp. CP2_5A]|nr:MAG: hypothetical protein CFK52_00160 [Chloracidobacterium sp. CP2_5A]